MLNSKLTCKRAGLAISYIVISCVSACDGSTSQFGGLQVEYFKDRVFSCTVNGSNISDNSASSIYFQNGGFVWKRPVSADGGTTAMPWQQSGAWDFDYLNQTIDVIGDELPPFSLGIDGISTYNSSLAIVCSRSQFACSATPE